MACPRPDGEPATDPDEALATRELVLKIIPDGAVWLSTPNTRFFGQAPEEWFGTPLEPHLRNRVFNYKCGCFS
jgi:hypothetical protein